MTQDSPASDSRPDAIGMVAGSGLLPVCFARGASRRGIRVVAAAIKGEASPELEQEVDEVHWTGLARLGKWIKIFKKAGVTRAVMCGGINKTRAFDGNRGLSLLPDLRSAKLWYKQLRSHEDHTVLQAVAEEFESEGIHIERSILYCPELLAGHGCLTAREPSEREWDDIRFGWPIIRQIAALQVGQSIVVKEKAVLAVEGIDGTDATLRRGGRLGNGDAVAIKVAKESHDERFDMPCVGPDTVETMAQSGVSVLAMDAEKTLVLEREQTVEKADGAGICLIGISESDVE